jgi:hypothetical protein
LVKKTRSNLKEAQVISVRSFGEMRAAIVLSSFVTTAWGGYSTSPSNSFIYDEYGRVSFFHGENFVQVSESLGSFRSH